MTIDLCEVVLGTWKLLKDTRATAGSLKFHWPLLSLLLYLDMLGIRHETFGIQVCGDCTAISVT